MCLLLVAHNCCAGYRLVVAANRDEFHARPTAPAAFWDDADDILGGRDLEAMGTWLACDRRGRFATITNVRSLHGPQAGRRSRGLIVTDFLHGDDRAPVFTRAMADSGEHYDGFNVLAYDGADLSWYSNQVGDATTLQEGIYTLSNAALDTAWTKSERLRAGFAATFSPPLHDPVETLLALLRDGDELANAMRAGGSGAQSAADLQSAIFISGEQYGTRCSTVLLIDDNNHLTFHERRYDAATRICGDTRHEFEVTLPAA